MANNSNDYNAEILTRSRRRFLQSAGAVGTVGFAGCVGGDDDENGSGNGDDDGNGNGNGNGNGDDDGNGNGNGNGNGDDDGNGDQLEINVINEASGIPEELQYNPFGQNFDSQSNRIAYEKLGTFDLRTYIDEGEPEWIPMAAEGWDIPDELSEGDTISITAASDRTWHDGDEITAEDLYTHFRLMYQFDSPVFDTVDPDSLEVVDEKTLEMTLIEDANPRILKMDLIGYQYGDRLNTKTDIYGEYLDAIENADSDEERDEAMQELTEFVLDEPVGTGWGKYVDGTEEMLIYETYDGSPIGSEMEFDRFTNRYTGDPQQSYQYALAEEIDYLGDTGSETVANQLVERGYTMFQHTYLSSSALQFNYDREPFDDVHVRKAFAYAIDLEKATQPIAIEGPWGQIRDPAPTPPTALMVNEEGYLGDLIDGFTSYDPYEVNLDMVEEVMEEGGYSQNSEGQWEMDGEVITVPITVYSDWNQKATYISSVDDDLTNAGFNVEINAIPAGEATSDTGAGEYDVVQGFWGQSWHPITMFDIFHPDEGWMTNNHPEEVEVPMPVGDPDGDVETVNVYELVENLRRAGPMDEEQEIVQQLAWIFNQTLPQIPVFLGYAGVHLYTEEWEIEDMDQWQRKLWDGEWEVFNHNLVKPRAN